MIFASGGLGAQADALGMMVVLTITFAIIVNFIAVIYTARVPASRVPTLLTFGSMIVVILSTVLTTIPSGGLTFCIGIVLLLLTLPCYALCEYRYNMNTPSVEPTAETRPTESSGQFPYPPKVSDANKSLMGSITVTFAIMFFTCLGCCGLSIPGMPLLDQILAGRAYSDIKESDVTVGMTKNELIARFGQPQSRNRDDDRWSYKKSMHDYVSIDFDKDGKVAKVNEWVD